MSGYPQYKWTDGATNRSKDISDHGLTCNHEERSLETGQRPHRDERGEVLGHGCPDGEHEENEDGKVIRMSSAKHLLVQSQNKPIPLPSTKEKKEEGRNR